MKLEALFAVTGLTGARAAANILVTCRNAGKCSLAQVTSQLVTAIFSNEIETAHSGLPNAFQYREVRSMDQAMSALKILVGIGFVTAGFPRLVSAIELQPSTLKAWNDYIRNADSSMETRLDARRPFLWIEQLAGADRTPPPW